MNLNSIAQWSTFFTGDIDVKLLEQTFRITFLVIVMLQIQGCRHLADLVVTNIFAPEFVITRAFVAGQPFNLQTGYTVENQGTAPAEHESNIVQVDWVLSTDEIVPPGGARITAGYAEDALLPGGRDQVELPIGPGDSVVSELFVPNNLSIHADTPPGVYYLCAYVDPFDIIAENSETNNVTCHTIIVDSTIDGTPFCLDFEEEHHSDSDFDASTHIHAVPETDAINLYSTKGIWFTSNPKITFNPVLSDRFQALVQGDIEAARPETTCGTLEFHLSNELSADQVSLEARNVGFIPFPVHIEGLAYGRKNGEEIEVDRFDFTSQSSLGDLSTMVEVTLESDLDGDATADPPELPEPPISRVTLDYLTCPPLTMVDNLCVRGDSRSSEYFSGLQLPGGPSSGDCDIEEFSFTQATMILRIRSDNTIEVSRTVTPSFEEKGILNDDGSFTAGPTTRSVDPSIFDDCEFETNIRGDIVGDTARGEIITVLRCETTDGMCSETLETTFSLDRSGP